MVLLPNSMEKGLAHYACNNAGRFRSPTCNAYIRSWPVQHRLSPATLLLCHCHLFYNGIFPKTTNCSYRLTSTHAHRFSRLFVDEFLELIKFEGLTIFVKWTCNKNVDNELSHAALFSFNLLRLQENQIL
jgi:hypothetical protein